MLLNILAGPAIPQLLPAKPSPSTCTDLGSTTCYAPSITSLSGFSGTLFTIIGVLYFLVIAGIVGFLAKAFLQYSAARQQGYTEKVTEAAKDIKHALIGLIGAGLIPVIVAAVLSLTGTSFTS